MVDLGILFHIFPFMNLGITGKDIFKKNIEVSTTYASGISIFTSKKNLILTSDLVYKEINNEKD